jgi:hypothetical protein
MAIRELEKLPRCAVRVESMVGHIGRKDSVFLESANFLRIFCGKTDEIEVYIRFYLYFCNQIEKK